MAYGTKNFDKFIPELWSARLLQNLDNTHVFANCVNRDYEGEIKNIGDTVHIQKFGDITVSDYTKASGVGTPADPGGGSTVSLVIDQAKYFNFKVEDIEAVQANVNLMEKAMQRAAYAVGEVTDKYIAAMVDDEAVTFEFGTESAPKALSASNAYDTLVDLKVQFNKKNIPSIGRFVVVPPEFLGLLEKDDRYTKYTQNQDVKANGIKGKVAGFDIYESNNVVTKEVGSSQKVLHYHIMAGTDMAISYAGQISKIEAYRPEASFSDACKGLYVFGAKIVEPSAICRMDCTF